MFPAVRSYEPLDLIDKLRLQVHLSICGNCRHMEEQLNLIHRVGTNIGTLDPCDDSDDAAAPPMNSPTWVRNAAQAAAFGLLHCC